MTRRLLIKNGNILSQDPAIGDLARGDILIESDRITAIGAELPSDDAEVVDAEGMIVLPGFVDTHRHTWQAQLRGTASNWTLFDYMTRLRLGYSSCYDPEDAYVGNLAGAYEALNAGVTTIVDHSHIMNSPDHADEAVRGLREAGIRAIFCYGIFPNPQREPFRFDFDATGWRLDDIRRLRKDIIPGDDGPIYFGLAPNEVERSEFKNACAEINLGRELGAKIISLHTAYGSISTKDGRQVQIVTRLAQERLLGPDVLLIHCNTLTQHELNIVTDMGSSISSTPEVEMQMGMGRPITARAIAAGTKISLGVDIVSNIPGDMFGPMRITLMELRAEQNQPMVEQNEVVRRLDTTCRDMVRLATIGGAEAANLAHDIGSLTVGKKADVICVRRNSLNLMGALDPYAALVHYTTPQDVDTVIVDGHLRKRDGTFVGPSAAEVVSMAQSSRNRIEHRMQAVDYKEREDFYKGRFVFGN